MENYAFLFQLLSFLVCIVSVNSVLQVDVQTFFYTQTLDHLGFASSLKNISFQQKYIIDRKYWSGKDNHGPILVYFGGESPIDISLHTVGIISKSASRLRAMVLYIEHRFYGNSIPFGSIDMALQTPDLRNSLNSVQALADYAEIIISLKANLSAEKSPVIVIGGSYSGLLAAWFRLKYPNISIGSLASSAPVFISEKLSQEDEYCSIIGRDFQQVNRRCHAIISQSWALIDQMGSRVNGLDLLKDKFNLCSDLISLTELKEHLMEVYFFASQYNRLENYWISQICDAIVRGKDDILAGIANALSYIHDDTCIPLDFAGANSVLDVLDINSEKAWDWQVCNEFIQRDDCTGNNQMFPAKTFDLTQYNSDCQSEYGAQPTPNWASTTYYGGQDIKTSFLKYGSNIIFSNGLMDPFSGASVRQDISNTIIALNTKEGSHCLDVVSEHPNDPRWLKKQREKELDIFIHWIKEYEHATGISVDIGFATREFFSNNSIFVTLFLVLYFLY